MPSKAAQGIAETVLRADSAARVSHDAAALEDDDKGDPVLLVMVVAELKAGDMNDDDGGDDRE